MNLNIPFFNTIWAKIPPHIQDILERVAWTFGQAFAGAWVITQNSGMKAAAIAGFAAGVSAVKNYLKTLKTAKAAQDGLAAGVGVDAPPADVPPIASDAPADQ